MPVRFRLVGELGLVKSLRQQVAGPDVSSSIYPPQKHKKDQLRRCLNVKNKPFYFSAHSPWLKSTSNACLEPKSVYKTMKKQ